MCVGRGHYNFVVIAPMIMKFGTGIKLDVFYTVVIKTFVTSLLLRNYDVITCILAPKTPKTLHNLAEIWYSEVFWGACFKYQDRFYF